MIARLTTVSSLDFTNLSLSTELENKLRRADLFTQGIVACCSDLLHGLSFNGETTGLFISTSYGPMQCNLDVLDFLVEDEPLSPTLFSHSVFNGASGYLARIFNIHGPALTQTSYGYPFFTALAQAKFAIEQGQLEQAIVIQAETYSKLLSDAKQDKVKPWPPGAVAWFLSEEGIALEHIEINERPCSPDDRLHHSVTCSTGTIHHHPLSMTQELNLLFTTGALPKSYDLSSPFGTVQIKFGSSS